MLGSYSNSKKALTVAGTEWLQQREVGSEAGSKNTVSRLSPQ